MPSPVPSYHSDVRDILRQAKEVQQSIKLVKWDPATYGRRFFHRSPDRISKSGETNYLNMCLDLTILLAWKLKQQGYKPSFVVQEQIHERTNNPAFHFALEIPVGKNVITINYRGGKNIVWHEGKFDPKKLLPPLKSLSIRRISTKHLTGKTTPLRLMGIRSIRNFGRITTAVKYPHIRRAFQDMKDSNARPQIFERLATQRPTIRRVRK